MGNVISFILIFLLIWEFLIWRRMTKYRKDLIQLRSAMARYLHRRKQLLKIMQQYAETHDLSFASWDKVKCTPCQGQILYADRGVKLWNVALKDGFLIDCFGC